MDSNYILYIIISMVFCMHTENHEIWEQLLPQRLMKISL